MPLNKQLEVAARLALYTPGDQRYEDLIWIQVAIGDNPDVITVPQGSKHTNFWVELPNGVHFLLSAAPRDSTGDLLDSSFGTAYDISGLPIQERQVLVHLASDVHPLHLVQDGTRVHLRTLGGVGSVEEASDAEAVSAAAGAAVSGSVADNDVPVWMTMYDMRIPSCLSSVLPPVT